MSMTPGTRFGQYEVAALIGVGGMGEVYRATDTVLKRDVALKVLPESLVTDANRLARLKREAEVLAALNHPNVAQVYGLEHSGGRTALVMELVDGSTLAERIAQGALPPNEALDVALQIVSALEAAHERGIVHRDLKPQNIQLKHDGSVRVLDFGIAKALDARAVSGPQPSLTTPSMTEAGVVLGTAAYMSPEQARGKPVDRRADVWAFGCVLYEMLTGKRAFEGDDMTTTLARVLEREPDMRKLPSGLPPAVRSSLELCLQKDPTKRLRDIGDVRLALEGQLVGASAVAARPLWRRALPIAAAVAITAVIAGAYVATVQPPSPSPAVSEQAQPTLPVTRFVVTPPPSTPLANLGGYDVMISPDGQRIAYFAVTPEKDTAALYVREIDGLEARLVPGTEVANSMGVGGGNMNPFFSADSRSIGFLSPDRGGVVRISVDGGPPLKILDAPEPAFLGATWSADDTLVYSSGRALYRGSAGGGATPERLIEIPDAFVASPVLLPGGRAVMYGVVGSGVERVAVLDLEKREQKILIENGQNAFYSPTGHVVFARGTTIMAVPFNASELSLTGDPVALIDNVRHPNPLTAADFALSASGTLVYVPGTGAEEARAAAVWVDRKGEVVGQATPQPVNTPRDPALSPDGTRLLLVTGSPTDGEIWSYDLRGRPPIRLAVLNDNHYPVWSPDSREMAFMTLENAIATIYVLPTDGSMLTPRPLRTEAVVGGPRVWSAAGELLYVRPPLATADINAISVAEVEAPRPIVATEYAEYDPALSPDGRWLAYASTRTGRSEIWVQRYPEGVATRVSGDGGYEPRWSADGRELFYLQANAMMAASMDPGDEVSFSVPVQLFTVGRFLAVPNPNVVSYDVARDGRFLMIEQSQAADDGRSTGIVVVQNWTEELKRRVPGRAAR